MAVSAVLLFYGSVYFILDVAIIILHKNQHSNLWEIPNNMDVL